MGALDKPPKLAARSPARSALTAREAASAAMAGKPGARASAITARLAVYQLQPMDRVALIRKGVPAHRVEELASLMGVTQESLIDMLSLSRATVSRKVKNKALLSTDETERVLGLEHLIGQMQVQVGESGDPAGFDAAVWVGKWLGTPLPALGGNVAAAYMDTIEGQKFVANLLARTQSGAYS